LSEPVVHDDLLARHRNGGPAVPRGLARFAVIAAILILRRPDAVLNPQFWAEDALIFFKDALLHPFADTVFRPYAGYLHVIPRLIAAATVRTIPATWAPAAFNDAAILLAAGSLWLFSLPRFRFLLDSDWARFFACCLVAVAHPGVEIINTLANAHWYLTLAALLLLVMPASGRWEAAAIAMALALISLSAPLCLLLMPLALYMTQRRNRGAARFGAATIVVVCGVQVCVAARIAAPSVGLNLELAGVGLWTVDFLRCEFLYLLLGRPAAQSLCTNVMPASWGLSAVLLAALLMVLWRKNPAARRGAEGLAWAVCLGWMILPFLMRRLAETRVEQLLYSNGEPVGTRYLFLPYCLLVFLIARAIAELRDGGRAARAAGHALGVTLVLAAATGGLRAKAFEDYKWRKEVRAARRGGPIAISVNPPGWTLEMPSGTLR